MTSKVDWVAGSGMTGRTGNKEEVVVGGEERGEEVGMVWGVMVVGSVLEDSVKGWVKVGGGMGDMEVHVLDWTDSNTAW